MSATFKNLVTIEKRSERSTWLHARPEAHFTSHRLLLDKSYISSFV